MILWIGVLSRLPLSAAYPLLSISYVLVYLVATSFPAWGELASGRRTAGILLIMLGVGLVSLPARRSDA
jgi:undecaprenyl phosphate-alpha-L-ara4N flippase subunit ArnF